MQHPETQPAGISTAPLEWDRWLCEIEHLWQDNAKEQVLHKLEEAFRSVEPRQLHAFVLHLLDKSQDLRRMKASSLALVVLKEFLQWVKKNSHKLPKDPSAIITDGMKLHALRLATSAHINLFDMICELYHLKYEGNEYLATHLRILLARKQFKEAGVAAFKLQLQHCFKIEEICLPLVFQDKVNLVEKYIQDSKESQVELIQRLDSFCAKDSKLPDIIDKLDMPGVRRDKLRPKYLSKLIVRLTKLFKLDSAICPNTNYHKDLGAVRFLLYKKYIELTLDAENWNELVKNTIRDNKALQEELINLLVEYNDPPAAAMWAEHYGIDQSKLTAYVAGAIATCPPPSDEPDNWDDVKTPRVPFYQLSLPLEHIVMVGNVGLLEVCEQHICQDDQLVGIDMEWTPSFTTTQTARVALVQLATFDWIYLLDMPTLMANAADRIASFFLRFLSSSQVLKLGFGISSDFKMLSKSYPSLKGPVAAVQRMVDLDTLTKQILKAEPDFLKSVKTSETDSSGPPVKGLSELTLTCFGRTLDKKEQLSDWEKRPLRPSQAQYAALDAFCLLEIYTFLKTKVGDAWLDIDMEPTYCSKMTKKPKSKTKERKPTKTKAVSQAGFKSAIQDSSQSLRPGDLSVVCDTMLQGLGRQLRACGVDVKILESSDEHDEAARIAFKEGRMILTSGTPYQTLKSQVGEGRCLTVDTKCNARQQTVQVFDHFNVRVRQEDVFSRCQMCNNNIYLQLNNKDMKRLWNKKKELLAAKSIAVGIPASSEGTATEILASLESTAAEIPASSKSTAAEIPASSESTAAEIIASPESTAAEIPASSSTGTGVSAKYLTRPLHQYDSDDDDGGLFLDFEEDFEGGGGDYYNIARPSFEAESSGTAWSPASPNKKVVSSALPQVASPADIPMSKTTQPANSQLGPSPKSTEEDLKTLPAKVPFWTRNANPHYKPPIDCDLEGTIDYDKVTFGNDVQLLVEAVPEGIIEKVPKFFCCSGCGKVFWEGSHFDRVVSRFKHVLDFSSDLDA